jgi:hypothetical protein
MWFDLCVVLVDYAFAGPKVWNEPKLLLDSQVVLNTFESEPGSCGLSGLYLISYQKFDVDWAHHSRMHVKL